MKMNVKLLRKVQKHMAAEPRRINMNTIVRAVSEDIAPCGTVGCIAGWTCVLSGLKERDSDLDKAQELLGLDVAQRDRLFAEPRYALLGDAHGTRYTAFWPKKFARRYENSQTPKGRASAVRDRIDHFIATKGAE